VIVNAQIGRPHRRCAMEDVEHQCYGIWITKMGLLICRLIWVTREVTGPRTYDARRMRCRDATTDEMIGTTAWATRRERAEQENELEMYKGTWDH